MPKIFKKSGFGLDISDHSIEFLELGSKSKVKTFSRIILEPETVRNGLIIDKKKLIKKIKELVTKAKTKTNQVVLSLPESKVFIHIFQIPKGLKGKALKNAVAFESPKVIPLDQEKVYWDCQVVSFLTKSNEQAVLYVAVPKEIIDNYLDLLNQVNLKPIIFEIESLALGRALLKDLKPKNSIMIVDIGARTTNVSIFNKNKQLEWSSSVAVAGNQFTQAIAKKLNIPLDKAEDLKRKQGLSEKSKVILILQKEFQTIIKEIENVLRYYQEPVDEILLVGGSAQIPELPSYLSTNLKKQVSLGQSSITKQLKGQSILYSTVIGLALRALNGDKKGEINLLPQKIKTKSSFVSSKTQESKLFQTFGYVFPLLSLVFLGWVIINYTPKKPRFIDLPLRPPLNQQLDQEQIVPEQKTPEHSEAEEKIVEKVIQVVIQQGISRLNVRSGPGSDYNIVTKVYPGQAYDLLQETEEWYKIKIDEQTQGWVSSKYSLLQEKSLEQKLN